MISLYFFSYSHRWWIVFLHKRRFPQTYKQFIHKITSCLQKLCTMVDNFIKFLLYQLFLLFITVLFLCISLWISTFSFDLSTVLWIKLSKSHFFCDFLQPIVENFFERWYTVKWIRILKTIEGGAFMNSIQEFWKLLLEHFEKTNSEFTFNHWIKPAEPIRIEQNILYIKVPSKTFARYWQDNLIRDIMEIGYDYFR